LFYQGEDFVFEAFLYDFGAPITTEDFEIVVVVKPSVRSLTKTWSAELNVGLYVQPGRPGYYEIWIPADATATWPAGTYYMDIVARSKFGANMGRRTYTTVLKTVPFSVEYSVYSSHPETQASGTGGLSRSDIERTWPNRASTVSRHPSLEQEPPATI